MKSNTLPGFNELNSADELSRPALPAQETPAGRVAARMVSVQTDIYELSQPSLQVCIAPTSTVLPRVSTRSLPQMHLPLATRLLLRRASIISHDIGQRHWKKAIEPQLMKHFTSALYYSHFKEFGISSKHPELLKDLMLGLNDLWLKYGGQSEPRTSYFIDCVDRVLSAEREDSVELYCDLAGPDSEYAFGARNGGEWMREYRIFRRFFEIPADFSKTEQALLDALDELDILVKQLPALSVSAFVPVTAQSESWGLTSQSQFENHIENGLAARVIGSQGRTNAYDLSAQAEKEAQRLDEKFRRNVACSPVITRAVDPQFVRLEIHKDDEIKFFEANGFERPYRGPELKWGVKTHVSSDAMFDLMVSTETSMSSRLEFSDSMFEVTSESAIGGGYLVTRQPLSDAKRERVAAIQNARTMLLTYFDIEKMRKECQVNYPIDR